MKKKKLVAPPFYKIENGGGKVQTVVPILATAFCYFGNACHCVRVVTYRVGRQSVDIKYYQAPATAGRGPWRMRPVKSDWLRF
jgi:hypothetical protein